MLRGSMLVFLKKRSTSSLQTRVVPRSYGGTRQNGKNHTPLLGKVGDGTYAVWEYRLKYEKLMFTHIDIVNDMRKYLVDIDGDKSDEGEWLKESPADYERLSTLIEEDLVKRTNNLSELVRFPENDLRTDYHTDTRL